MFNLKSLLLLAKYNLKIVFGGKFIWFAIVAVVFFVFLLFQIAYDGTEPTEDLVYSSLLMPALMLIFYPTVYGLQNDEENKILEIIFSIPNYMYKVWLLRLIFVFIESFVILLLLCVVANFLFCPIEIFEMAIQMMSPLFFFGNLAFLLSTIIKGGNGTAVVFIFVVAGLVMLGQSYSNTMWNVLINPFSEIDTIHPTVWANTLANNRLFLFAASFGCILVALMNLQKRERLL
ncbi:MAG: hypothetical protein R3Y04_05805 [Rikenellaceae bacterium]